MNIQSQIEEARTIVSQISSQGLNAQTILLAMIVIELNNKNTKDKTHGSTKRRKGEISEGQ